MTEIHFRKGILTPAPKEQNIKDEKMRARPILETEIEVVVITEEINAWIINKIQKVLTSLGIISPVFENLFEKTNPKRPITENK